MAKAKKKISKIKVKKKSWFKLVSPDLFGNKEIGEMYLAAPNSAVGRKLKVTLKELSGNVRDQHAYVNFKISKLDGSVLRTEIIGCGLTSSYVKRMVRKNTARLDDYFNLKTKDNKEFIVKSLTVTLHKTNRSVKSEIRRQLYDLLQEEASKYDFVGFVNNVIGKRVQTSLKKKLSKVYPVKEVAIRTLKMKETKTFVNKAKEQVSQEAVQEE